MRHDEEMAELRSAERRAAIEEVAAQIIEEVSEWSAAHPRAQWDELEKEVLKARKQFGERLMETLVREREEVRPVPGPQCAKCGKEMHYKGQKKRHVVSSIGETQIERCHYYCSECKTSVFPPR
jgi:hypothetical protein